MSEVLELTCELIRRASVTPDDAGCQTLIAERLRRAGFHVESLRFGDVDNLWATHGGDGPVLAFLGHTDVVPSGPAAQWHSPPFEPTLRDGLLYGRGAADMKGSVAAFVLALEAFVARHPQHAGRIALLLTSDEEGVARDGVRRVAETFRARGERLDWCVVGEPSSSERLGDMIRVGRRGSLSGYLTVRGVQGHVAYPDRLDNAIHRLSALIEALVREPIDQGSTHFQPTSLQFTTVDVGNKATNIAPGVATARFNTRFNDLWTSKTLLAHLTERLERANAALGGNGLFELKAEVSGESFYTPPGPLSDLVAGAIRDVTGVETELSTTGGTSDARFIRSYCPVLEFGLVGESMHKVDEKSAIADLKTLADVYETVLDRFFAA